MSYNGADPALPDNRNAISLAMAEGAARNERVVLGRGSYACAGGQPLILRSGTKLEGQGPDRSTLRKADQTSYALFAMIGSTRLGYRNISMEGMTLDANGQNQSANFQLIQIAQTIGTTLKNLKCINVPGNALNAADTDTDGAYTFAFEPAGNIVFTATTNGTVTLSNVSSYTYLQVGARVTGSGIPAGARITALYPGSAQLSISLAATASQSIAVSAGVVVYINTPPEGMDYAANLDFVMRDCEFYSIAGDAKPGGGTYGVPGADFVVVYKVRGGEISNCRFEGGQANQLAVGFAQDFVVRNTRHYRFWRGLYMETSLNVDVDSPHFASFASSIANPGQATQSPVCIEIATADLTYNPPAAGFAGGRNITVDSLSAEGLNNSVNGYGVDVVRLIAENNIQSKNIIFRDPKINNITCTVSSAGNDSDGLPLSLCHAFRFDGHHEGTKIRGGYIGNINDAFRDKYGLFGGTRRMVDPEIADVTFENINDVIIRQTGSGHEGLKRTGWTLRGGINAPQLFSGGADVQVRQVSYGHRGAGAGGVMLPDSLAAIATMVQDMRVGTIADAYVDSANAGVGPMNEAPVGSALVGIQQYEPTAGGGARNYYQRSRPIQKKINGVWTTIGV